MNLSSWKATLALGFLLGPIYAWLTGWSLEAGYLWLALGPMLMLVTKLIRCLFGARHLMSWVLPSLFSLPILMHGLSLTFGWLGFSGTADHFYYYRFGIMGIVLPIIIIAVMVNTFSCRSSENCTY